MDLDSKNKLGILCAIGASSAFSLNDALFKLLGGTYPLHQVVFIRSVVAILLILIVIVPVEGGISTLKTRQPALQIIRGCSLVIANIAFFSGLIVLPIANAMAVFFMAPFLVTIFSAVILHEKVNIRRWLALAVGLFGVFLIVRPGSTDFQWAYLLPFIAATAYATCNTIARGMGLSESAGSMAFFSQLTFLVASTSASLVLGTGHFSGHEHPSVEFLLRGWLMPDKLGWILILSTGLLNVVGGYLISHAYRYGESGIVTPFEYVALVLAICWGYLFWQEIPTIISATGICFILISGVFVAVAEARFDVKQQLRKIFKY